MTDARFQQLVNLYLDGEITPSEETLLAIEIRDNPERRAKFLRYKQLHLAAAKAFHEHHVVFERTAHSARSRPMAITITLTSGALVACVALTAVYLSAPRSTPSLPYASATPAPVETPINPLPPTAVAFRNVIPVADEEEPLLHRTWEEAQIGLLKSLRYDAVVYGANHELNTVYRSVFDSGNAHGNRHNSMFVISQGEHWNTYK